MTNLWVTGLVLAVFAVGWLLRRAFRQSEVLETPAMTDIPLWDAEEYHPREFWPELAGQTEDTAPAILTPPEWKEPKAVANGTQRRFDL
ncbi:MAG: hypothetical protein ABI887_16550 [Burkholderiales bacterium]